VIRLAANVSMLFTEEAFPDRFEAAARAGFSAVECQFPYAFEASYLRRRLRAAGVDLVLLNAPPGNFDQGDRGLAAVVGREAEFRASIEEALRYAEALACPRVHVMAGVVDAAGTEAVDRYVQRLGWATDRLAAAGTTVLIEPLNRRDFPGYLLAGTVQAEEVIAAVGRSSLRLQFDTYHLQILEGDLLTSFRRCGDVVGHVQVAAVPDRGEPDAGEVDHEWLLEQFDASGYAGWVGAEYRPRASTVAGLRWAERYGVARPAVRP
jgi:hydroxypyruvate isomerase